MLSLLGQLDLSWIWTWIVDLFESWFPSITLTILIVVVVLIALIPLSLSIWVGIDASRDPKHLREGTTKNNGMGFLWWFLSFFFFIPVMFIYLFYRTPSKDRKSRHKAKGKKERF